MNHDIIKIDGKKINSSNIFLLLNFKDINNIIIKNYNSILNEFIIENKIDLNIPLNVDDDFSWEENIDCKDWTVYLINSIFVADGAYSSEEKYLEWGNKYGIGYSLILLSSTLCWNKSSIKRLYFDAFDINRLQNINILMNNWEKKSNLFEIFHLKHFINKSNIDILKIKWNFIKLFVTRLLSADIIKNDFDLYILIFILSSSIQNDFTLNLNTFECISYNFNNSDNPLIRQKFVHEITENTKNDIKYNKKKIKIGKINEYSNLFHVNYGYLGQIIRIIGSRDKGIKSKSLLLFRDGHATAPSIYDKLNMRLFIKSNKLYKIGTSVLYSSPWHKLGLNTYRKGILMGCN